MPIYEYKCPQCQRRQDELHPSGQVLSLTCENCQTAMVRQFPTPALRTSSTFLAGRNYDEFHGNKRARAHYEAMARQAGVNPTGKQYFGNLAMFPGDPRAWVGHPDDVRKYCLETGRSCDGAITVKGADPLPHEEGPYRVADDLVEKEVTRRLDGEYVHGQELGDLRERVATELAGAQS